MIRPYINRKGVFHIGIPCNRCNEHYHVNHTFYTCRRWMSLPQHVASPSAMFRMILLCYNLSVNTHLNNHAYELKVRFNEKTTVLAFHSNPLRGSDRSHDTNYTLCIHEPCHPGTVYLDGQLVGGHACRMSKPLYILCCCSGGLVLFRPFT